ncbi:MAG: hypothetical protein ACRDNS_27775 [Trebonia sp.]
MIDANTVEPMPEPDPDAEFWSQRDELDHVLRFARSRRVAPFPVLGCVLRRAVACVPPSVVLPPIVGDVASVNIYTGSSGRSGRGKGGADAAGFAAVRFLDASGIEIDTPRPNPGSGEGLARLFKGRGDNEPAITAAHLIVPEVGTLAALASRQGSTLSAELLKGFMGEPLGFTNAHKDTTTAIAAHSYRLCLGVGVQPENAEFFLSREKDGFPQRFWWLQTIDPHAPEVRPAPVEPIDITVPDFGPDRCIVPIPAQAADEIDAHRHRVLIGSDDVDPLDGHLMLTRLKVGFGLAVLAGRKGVDADDWKIAGELIEVSKQVRDDMRAAVDERRRRENQAKAFDAADRDAIIAARLSEDTQKRVAQAITRKLRRVESATRLELRRACDSSIRNDFDGVFDLFLDKQFLACCGGGDGHAARYRLAG